MAVVVTGAVTAARYGSRIRHESYRRSSGQRQLDSPRFPDGIKEDVGGRVYSSSLSGVQVFGPHEPVNEIVLASAANFASCRTTLLITTDTAIWATELSSKGD
jgi:sugar lactone lactonase YvrE